MKRHVFIPVIVLVSLLSPAVTAQHLPMYTHYMFNGLVLNPAYAGSQETVVATAVMRKQWVGIEDAPQTQTLSVHSPMERWGKNSGISRVGVGLTLFNDQVAITRQTGLLASYAYRLELSNGNFFSLGLQGGFSQLRIRYSDLELDDPAFAMGDISSWQPEFGAGLYYQSTDFYAGLSAPQMLRNQKRINRNSLILTPHYFLTSGYLISAGEAVKIKPNILVKYFSGDIFQLDVNCNVFLHDIVNVGVSWRSLESVSGLLQFYLNKKVSFGYAYDIPFADEPSRQGSGSHEVMLSYRTPQKRVRTINPRFF